MNFGISDIIELNIKRMTNRIIVIAALVLASGFFIASADEDSTSKYSIFEDADQDELSDAEEKTFGTDPQNKDTDGDGFSDGVEIASGYDPLRPAPGDRIGGSTSVVDKSDASEESVEGDNDTEAVKEKVVQLLEESQSTGEELTMDKLERAIQDAVDIDASEIILPEVSEDEIVIKKIKGRKNLSDEELKEIERQDTLEYLTSLSYLLASNSPKKFSSQSELSSVANSLISDTMMAVSAMNYVSIGSLAERGEAMLKELKGIEVPEDMVDIHTQALRVAKYSVSLKDELTSNASDPLGQIKVLSKAQGVMMIAADLSTQVGLKIMELGIESIPIDL